MNAANLLAPEFKTKGIFTVVFKRTVEKTVEEILNAIQENPKITAKEIQVITGLSRRGVENQLDKLKKDKLIERIGPDRGGEWRILNRN